MEVKKSVAIALSMTTGLYTPMVRSVDTHSLPILDSKCPACSYPWCGGALTVSNMGAIGAGESTRPVPVLVLGGSIAIVALGHARWVWDVEQGDGKGERRLKRLRWALAGQ